MTDVPAHERTQVMRFEVFPWNPLDAPLGLASRKVSLGRFEFTASDGYIHSKAFICPKCGRLWGRVSYIIENQPALHHSHEAITSSCSEHGGGSLIDHIHTEQIKLLPRALLEYEILETHYAGKARPSNPQRRPSPSGQPDPPHGSARHG